MYKIIACNEGNINNFERNRIIHANTIELWLIITTCSTRINSSYTCVQGINWEGGPRVRNPADIFSNIEQIFNYKRESSRYPRLEKLGSPQNFFSVTALLVFFLCLDF